MARCTKSKKPPAHANSVHNYIAHLQIYIYNIVADVNDWNMYDLYKNYDTPVLARPYREGQP